VVVPREGRRSMPGAWPAVFSGEAPDRRMAGL